MNRAESRRELRAASKTELAQLDILANQGAMALAHRVFVDTGSQMCEDEADKLCGAAKGIHSDKRRAWRHGTKECTIIFGGAKIGFVRPRVRSEDGELPLPSYLAAQDPHLLNDAIWKHSICRVSSRDYKGIIMTHQQLDKEDARGISKSSVSRRLQIRSQQLLEEVLTRPLADEHYLALYLDGIQLGGYQVVAALGITLEGEKRFLGLCEGVTENTETCKFLLEGLIDRGLTTDEGLLVVIDGGKGLRAAIKELWGDAVAVQRCRIHKRRNIKDKLPEDRRRFTLAQLDKAWAEQRR